MTVSDSVLTPLLSERDFSYFHAHVSDSVSKNRYHESDWIEAKRSLTKGCTLFCLMEQCEAERQDLSLRIDELIKKLRFLGKKSTKEPKWLWFIVRVPSAFCIDPKENFVNEVVRCQQALDRRNIEILDRKLKGRVTEFRPEYMNLAEGRLILSNHLLSVLNVTNLSNLTLVSLRKNQLCELPTGIGQLRELQCFDISYNKIKVVNEELFDCRKLEFLRMDHNEIEQIPVAINQCHALKVLSLDHNQLSVLPDELGSFEQLRGLCLDNNRIVRLPVTYGNLTSLVKLTLYDNPLASNQDVVRKLRRIVLANIRCERCCNRV